MYTENYNTCTSIQHGFIRWKVVGNSRHLKSFTVIRYGVSLVICLTCSVEVCKEENVESCLLQPIATCVITILIKVSKSFFFEKLTTCFKTNNKKRTKWNFQTFRKYCFIVFYDFNYVWGGFHVYLSCAQEDWGLLILITLNIALIRGIFYLCMT